MDEQLHPLERFFAYLPFDIENLKDQSLRSPFYQLASNGTPVLKKIRLRGPVRQRHHEIIARLGRFPHRNAILGRISTPEELEFLKEPMSAF